MFNNSKICGKIVIEGQATKPIYFKNCQFMGGVSKTNEQFSSASSASTQQRNYAILENCYFQSGDELVTKT